MRTNYGNQRNGYLETIQNGIQGVRTFRQGMTKGAFSREEAIRILQTEIETADAIVIGAGAGLSTAAGFTYSGERFDRYFSDFRDTYGIRDMYSGGFYPFPDAETRWAWWARHIYFNRYVDAPKPVYQDLLNLVQDKEYFVITTNVDHQFQKSGFDKARLFYTQGDYGLFQSMDATIQKTFDNEAWVLEAMSAQGFVVNEQGFYDLPSNGQIQMRIPSALVPMCDGQEILFSKTACGENPVVENKDLDAEPSAKRGAAASHVTMNLRADDSFVEDEGWHRASAAYAEFLETHEGQHVLFLELGVGMNTPVIVKYPFWQMTRENPNAVYACLNYNEAYCPEEIADRSICVDSDVAEVLKEILY